jgi:hypothetical protein
VAGRSADLPSSHPAAGPRSMRCGATLSGWPYCASRSRQSNRPAWCVWSGRQNAMVRMLASIRGVGFETADMLVREVLPRNLRDRKAVARYAGLTVRRMKAGPSDARKVSPNRAKRSSLLPASCSSRSGARQAICNHGVVDVPANMVKFYPGMTAPVGYDLGSALDSQCPNQ